MAHHKIITDKLKKKYPDNKFDHIVKIWFRKIRKKISQLGLRKIN